MSKDTRHRSPLRFLFTLLLVLIVAAGAVTFVLWRSATGINERALSAQASFEAGVEQVNSQDYRDALVSLRTTASDLEQIEADLQGWQWQAASYVPVLKDDVACARQTADVASTLANDALIPLLDQAEALMALTESANSLQVIPDTLAKLPELYETARNCRTVVATCKADADALPTSHFDQVNEMVLSVQQAAAQSEEAFAALDPLFQTLESLSELAGTLSGTTTQTEAPAA